MELIWQKFHPEWKEGKTEVGERTRFVVLRFYQRAAQAGNTHTNTHSHMHTCIFACLHTQTLLPLPHTHTHTHTRYGNLLWQVVFLHWWEHFSEQKSNKIIVDKSDQIRSTWSAIICASSLFPCFQLFAQAWLPPHFTGRKGELQEQVGWYLKLHAWDKWTSQKACVYLNRGVGFEEEKKKAQFNSDRHIINH